MGHISCIAAVAYGIVQDAVPMLRVTKAKTLSQRSGKYRQVRQVGIAPFGEGQCSHIAVRTVIGGGSGGTLPFGFGLGGLCLGLSSDRADAGIAVVRVFQLLKKAQSVDKALDTYDIMLLAEFHSLNGDWIFHIFFYTDVQHDVSCDQIG